MTVVNMQGKLIEETPMQQVINNPHVPLYHHGDVVEVWKHGKYVTTGRIRGVTCGWKARDIMPSYDVIPNGEYSFTQAVSACEDELRLIKAN